MKYSKGWGAALIVMLLHGSISISLKMQGWLSGLR